MKLTRLLSRVVSRLGNVFAKFDLVSWLLEVTGVDWVILVVVWLKPFKFEFVCWFSLSKWSFVFVDSVDSLTD